jgi:hypothetical protein
MEIREVIQIKYGDACPGESIMYLMREQIYNIWTELKNHVNSIHVIYAGANSDYAFFRRSKFGVEAEIREEYNKGKQNFIFQCLAEGMMVDNILLIDDVLELLKDILPNISVFYATGDHIANQSYKNICKKYSRPERINILAGAGFEFGSDSFLSFDKDYVPGPRLKKFLCFNKVTRQHRINLLEKLLKLNLVDASYYSFSIEPEDLNILKTHNNEAFNEILKIENKLPLTLNMTLERNNPVDVRSDDLIYFDNSYFSVVTETLFYNLDNRKLDALYMNVVETYPGVFFSEKIYKCLALRHPFVLVSTPGSLKELRKRGYKTFSPYIDEAYDDIMDDDERLNTITNEINRICNLSTEELIQFTHNIKEIVDHNFVHFSNTTDFRITKNVVSMLKYVYNYKSEGVKSWNQILRHQMQTK